ncbi:tRNA pseudouridine(55) synthase TruB [Hippea maritima]|uniref:tRNA pseudouridine synthase B n=1 Tax=Hippea maritima (strain ATCC 700847 / DSM 10411 / MH2) TaxID=760142 RepID=F2LVA8_HIPMA|nr:tRNA pseudouridine(55) synthase TruB [Hippea maritima]AEA33692.1 tRNA pseudouridine synthase B [Hippea maritima DSM 10411]
MKNSVILIDKPSGITSFDVIRKLRKITGIKKIGHAGVLDKMASGLLVCATNQATKLLSIFENGYKVYLAEFSFGLRSDTYDIWGRILENRGIKSIDGDELNKVIGEFVGKIKQKPPPFSNVRINGKRLYRYALEGESVEVKEREVYIHSIDILSVKQNRAVLRITCSKGTYVRSLANDIGNRLGIGGVVSSLRRLYVHPFSVDDAGDVYNPNVLEVSKALSFMPKIVVELNMMSKIKNGFPICKILKCFELESDFYKIVGPSEETVAVIEKVHKGYSYRVIFT